LADKAQARLDDDAKQGGAGTAVRAATIGESAAVESRLSEAGGTARHVLVAELLVELSKAQEAIA
jgi:hypothetical protein